MPSCLATSVRFDDSKLYVLLTDGRGVAVPIDWYPRLRDASEEARNSWRLIGRGQDIHWEDVDEDLFVAGFLKL